MLYLGAADYFFWMGIKDAVFFLSEPEGLGPNLGSKTQERCLEAYMDGYMIGQELSKLEYKELTNG